jgi:hypothetical protein
LVKKLQTAGDEGHAPSTPKVFERLAIITAKQTSARGPRCNRAGFRQIFAGDLYTAYTFIAVSAVAFGGG